MSVLYIFDTSSFFLFQNYTDMKSVRSLFSRDTPFTEQPEMLAIFGVMPLCLVLDREKKAQSAEQDYTEEFSRSALLLNSSLGSRK